MWTLYFIFILLLCTLLFELNLRFFTTCCRKMGLLDENFWPWMEQSLATIYESVWNSHQLMQLRQIGSCWIFPHDQGPSLSFKAGIIFDTRCSLLECNKSSCGVIHQQHQHHLFFPQQIISTLKTQIISLPIILYMYICIYICI